MTGQTIVISGTLRKKRSEYEKMIRQNGGRVSKSITKNTSCLLLGPDKEGGGKHRKALAYGVPVITESEFYQILQGGIQ